ncbi:SRPBCC family protein [Phenylobacterium sp. LjRoot219]|uniref:CoxG family protein n=1 Tax=Phenylobacterium sp. LjRoot219 TaxID=3342283 RepID=UPI003ECE85EF
MIETEQTISIDVPIDDVWTYVRDIERWANLMPGLRECEVLSDNDSRWTLKVGAGGMVRTVKVLVQVDEWDGPERVRFSYKLEGDPVEGGGTYVAVRKSARETEVTLKVQVVGGGPMAPMWEAMGKPLLPQFAKAFAGQLKTEIEATAAAAPPSAVTPKPSSPLAALGQWLRSVWRALAGAKSPQSTR